MSKTQSPSSRWRTHRQTRRAHHPVARWSGGSSLGRVCQTQSPKSRATVGARRASPMNAGPGSIVVVAPARVASRPRLPQLCQANSCPLKSGGRPTGEVWGSAAWVAYCKAPSGTLKSGAWATPTWSPGSRSAIPLKGITCRPEATKFSLTNSRLWQHVNKVMPCYHR